MAVLATSAAVTLIGAMATDGWEQIKQAVAGLWRRSRPERVEQVASDLEGARTELVAARAQGDAEAEAGLVTEWQGRLRRLLAADGQAAGELRVVLALGRDSIGGVQFGPVTHLGSGNVNQAGRDMIISQDYRDVPNRALDHAFGQDVETVEDDLGRAPGAGSTNG